MQKWKGLENEGRMDKMAQWVECYANVRTRTRMPSIHIHARWAMGQRQGLPEASWLPTLAKPSSSGVK